jgi:exopolyphosphatase/guanosine-5'-triphosphate,3'-diphosphate pyrophosphatase
MGMNNLVVLDFGSNSVRFSINQITGKNDFKEILRRKATTRLAEGMGLAKGEKRLTQGAIKRTMTAVADFKKIYQQYSDYQVVGIATAAVREAVNRQELLDQVTRLTGCRLQVLSADQETYFDFLAVTNSLSIKDCLIFDIGGGSCELAWVAAGNFQVGVSLPFGAVSLTEQFAAKDLTAANLFAMQRFLQEQFHNLPWLRQAVKLPLVLLGGCNRSVARIKRTEINLQPIDSFHGFKVTTSDFQRIYQQLLALSNQQRKEVPGMEALRSDIILAGMTPVVLLQQQLSSPRVIFSESGAREGFIYHQLQE